MKKDIGIGIKPPGGECRDPSCPWHGRIPVRGRAFQGSVRSAKSHNTVMVEWGYHKFIPKYERYERRRSRVAAHNPPCIHAKEGDMVIIAECRPLSKTKHFVVVGVVGKAKLEVRGEEQRIAMKEKTAKEEGKEPGEAESSGRPETPKEAKKGKAAGKEEKPAKEEPKQERKKSKRSDEE